MCSTSVSYLMALFPPRSFFLSPAKIALAEDCCSTQSGRMRRGRLGVSMCWLCSSEKEMEAVVQEIRCRAEVQAIMLRPACERLTSSWKALLSLLQLHAGAGVCAERLPAVGMSATSQAVIPVNYLLIADFFPPSPVGRRHWGISSDGYCSNQTPWCFTQVNEADLFF